MRRSDPGQDAGPSLTGEQRRNVRRIVATAKFRSATPRERKALIEATLVESNIRNLSYGDADSVGILQQRPSQGWGPRGESVEKDVGQFLDAARALRGSAQGSAGALAQRVQRSAYPHRYDEHSREADAILRAAGAGGHSSSVRASSTGTPAEEVGTPGDRAQLALDFLSGRVSAPDFAVAIKRSHEPVPGTGTPAPPKESAGRPSRSIQDGGGWGGTRNLARQAASIGKQLGAPVTSEKRTPASNTGVGGSPTSDHLTTNKNSYAVDLSTSGEAGDKLGERVARHFGVSYQRDSYDSGGTIDVHGTKYRVQILFGAKLDHADHVHVGFKRVS